ncbi:CaiB/BaiF CoA transferase family protein [Bradyrhizobium sp. 195]|uniref:CaiB/BaiF CoA transferase family protein n=1 Tax=Bradyrhizobium sp. 195 TaxID=2782662 RepID=UPI002000EF05|nr:CaiB/BaiF CoA-transferase family protein [Bradyrhizobium sp. 195]UPK29929.1 CoA transferase [Bradyrhizobium sp. 195]
MRALDGIKVVSIERDIAAPFCTSRLADAGATVLTIDHRNSDLVPSPDASTPEPIGCLAWLNRGKSSIALDFATEIGRQTLERLIATADVFMQNLGPGAMDALGFPLERLCSAYPGLICCNISAFGDTGPYAHRRTSDNLIQAESGLASITGGPEEPAVAGIPIIELATGATAHAAVLEALIARGLTGNGADIQISMFDVIADWLTAPLLNAEAGRSPKRTGLVHPLHAPHGVFRSKDGKNILVSIRSDGEWTRLCLEVLEAPTLPDDPRFRTAADRIRNRRATDQAVSDVFATYSRGSLVRRLTDAKIAFADVNTMADLSAHPHLRRVTAETSDGRVSFPAPAPIVIGESRNYGVAPGWQSSDRSGPQLTAAFTLIARD